MSTTETQYPLATSSWAESEYKAIQAVLSRGRFTMGPETLAMEKEFANYIGSQFAVMVNSGSSANLLMIAALRYHSRLHLGAEDEVLVPAVSWPTTYYPLHQYGLKMRFVDVSISTLNMDAELLPAAITPRTRAVLAVNLLGNPNDFATIKAFCDQNGLLLLEDNCEALGAEYEGRRTGSFGLMGSHSSFFSHHISTMEGGYVTTDDEELYHILLCLRAHGWTRDLPEVNTITGRKHPDWFSESFNFVLPGYNVRPIEMAAAVGRVQLSRLDDFIVTRRENAEYFRDALARFPVRIQEEVGASSWFGFSMVLPDDLVLERRRLVDQLYERGIESRPVVAGNFAKNRVVQLMEHSVAGNLSSAEIIDVGGLFVGNSEQDLRGQIDLLSEVLQQFFGT